MVKYEHFYIQLVQMYKDNLKGRCKMGINLTREHSENDLAWINETLKRCRNLYVIDPWTREGFRLDEKAREMLIKKYSSEVTGQSNKKEAELSVKIHVDTTELDEAIKKLGDLKALSFTFEALTASVTSLANQLNDIKATIKGDAIKV